MIDPTRLCQIELQVSDLKAATRFYDEAFGWKVVPAELHEYVVLQVPDGCPFGIALTPRRTLRPSQSSAPRHSQSVAEGEATPSHSQSVAEGEATPSHSQSVAEGEATPSHSQAREASRWESSLVLYFAVDDPEAVVNAVVAAGGRKRFGPMPLMGYGTIYQVEDPEGTRFGLYLKKTTTR